MCLYGLSESYRVEKVLTSLVNQKHIFPALQWRSTDLCLEYIDCVYRSSRAVCIDCRDVFNAADCWRIISLDPSPRAASLEKTDYLDTRLDFSRSGRCRPLPANAYSIGWTTWFGWVSVLAGVVNIVALLL